MARNDPQVNLRMPEALKTALDTAAQGNNRSLTAEIVARLETSFEIPADFDLKPVIARYERDLSSAELEAASNAIRTTFVAEALLAVTSAMPPKATLPGNPHNMTAEEWRSFAAAMVEQGKGPTRRLRQLMKEAERLQAAYDRSVADLPQEPPQKGFTVNLGPSLEAVEADARPTGALHNIKPKKKA
jgi:hypothetical protein